MGDHWIRISISKDNDRIEGKYLECVADMVKSGVTSIYCIQALLMNRFPELGLSGAFLIVEYWQAEIGAEDE